jgi:hypothetical protein
MPTPPQPPTPTDALSLITASMPELVAALAAEEEPTPDSGVVPPKALQIANLIAAEGVRLIRLGTRSELSEGAVALATLLAGRGGARLLAEQPRAHRIAAGTLVALKAATTPSSSAGELAVLRSWGGNASAAVAALRRAPEHTMRRAALRKALGVNESYLSHMLSDLEAASLIARTREGREVLVHLGASGRSKHVGQYLKGLDGDDSEVGSGRRLVESLFRAILDRAHAVSQRHTGMTYPDVRASGRLLGQDQLEQHVAALRQQLGSFRASIDETVVGKGRVLCWIRISGTPYEGSLGGGPVEHVRLWSARVENGQPVEVEGWAPDRTEYFEPTHHPITYVVDDRDYSQHLMPFQLGQVLGSLAAASQPKANYQYESHYGEVLELDDSPDLVVSLSGSIRRQRGNLSGSIRRQRAN